MQATSALYNSIFSDPLHALEWRISVNGVVYGKDKIASRAGNGDSRPKLTRKLLSGNEPTVGECIAATFSCAIFEASAAVPRMAQVVPECRLVLGNQASEWISLGTFFIDTRQEDKVSEALILTCYDRILMADGAGGKSYADVTGFSTWPQPMSAVVAEIASIIGVTVDSRNVIRSGSGYNVEYPGDYTMREVLGYIAAANGGNFVISPANALRLVPLTGGTDTFTVGTKANDLRTAPAFAAWRGVTVYWADEEAFEAGDDTGRRLVVDCPWATQRTADVLLSILSGSAYQPYTAPGCTIDPALELGDIVTVGLSGDTVTGPVMTINITADALGLADLSAPGEDEIDHEYPYSSYVDRSLKRKVSLGQSYYGTTISREKGIEIARSDGKSEALFNSDTFSMRALIDGIMKDRIYFDPAKGDYIFDGALGANAVFTDSLYAEAGDVAELTVDRLSTSKRIRMHNLGDTSDDNYVSIQDQHIQMITGTPIPNIQGGYLEEQATNRYGQPLYWQREPYSYDADGYPYDENGTQIYAVIEETDWPVMVYQYDEQVKGELSFESVNGTYIPQLIMGAGDDQGNSRGYLYKETEALVLQYINSHADSVEIVLGDDGYVEIRQLRRATQMNFAAWDAESFYEILDGGGLAQYFVTFDNDHRPIRIYDEEHSCSIIWE